jgi:hypothetical protein
MPARDAVRLRNIRIYGEATPPSAGVLLRRYELRYSMSAISGRSLLASVRESGSDGDAPDAIGLEATAFTSSQPSSKQPRADWEKAKIGHLPQEDQARTRSSAR